MSFELKKTKQMVKSASLRTTLDTRCVQGVFLVSIVSGKYQYHNWGWQLAEKQFQEIGTKVQMPPCTGRHGCANTTARRSPHSCTWALSSRPSWDVKISFLFHLLCYKKQRESWTQWLLSAFNHPFSAGRTLFWHCLIAWHLPPREAPASYDQAARLASSSPCLESKLFLLNLPQNS